MKFMAFRVVTSWGADFYAHSNAAYAFGGVPENETTDDAAEIDLVPSDERTAVVATIETFDRGGSVDLHSPARLLSGASAGFMPLREAVG
jgi:hypothetical protein